MNTIKFSKKNTQVVAHRGLSGIEAENTNAALLRQVIVLITVLKQISTELPTGGLLLIMTAILSV